MSIIEDLNANSKFQQTCPKLHLEHINSQNVINSINPAKDVDGFHPENVGWLSIGKPRFIPCTPKGIMRIFSHYNSDLTGKDIVVIGRSNIVGRPMSILKVQIMQMVHVPYVILEQKILMIIQEMLI